MLPLEDWASKTSSLGDSEVRGRKVYGLQITCPGEGEFKLYFDSQTGLLAKLHRRGRTYLFFGGTETSTDPLISNFYPLDYREVDGILQPARVEEWQDGSLEVEWNWTVTRIQFADQVDESQFTEP